jgi:hypothetical protein
VDTSQTAIAVTASSFLQIRSYGFLTGSSESNSSISINDGNTGTLLSQTSAGSAGNWSVIMGNLSNSVHNFIATASDSLGHAGSTQFVFGTTGNDTITSSAANEVLFGNGGHDTFAISGNVGRGTIADFQASNDMVQLSHNVFSNFADVLAHAAQVGSDVTISIDPSNSVTLHNTMLTQLTTNNFHLV